MYGINYLELMTILINEVNILIVKAIAFDKASLYSDPNPSNFLSFTYPFPYLATKSCFDLKYF